MNIRELQEKAVSIQKLYEQRDARDGKQIAGVESLVMQFVSDVGDLSRCITQKERGDMIENFDHKIAHELAECLAHVLVLADKYNINLEEVYNDEFDRLHKELCQ